MFVVYFKFPHHTLKRASRSGVKGVVDFEVSLDHIRMRDGTFESDVPVQAISELFNCHFSIVSQVNAPPNIYFFKLLSSVFHIFHSIGQPAYHPLLLSE